MTFEEFGLSEDVMRGLAAMNFKEACFCIICSV